MKLELQLIDQELTIAKLSDVDGMDELASRASFFSLTTTDDEISLVIDSTLVPSNQFTSPGWKAFKITGPLDFSLVGILQKVIEPLSENGISIFSISTYDTDYILVKNEQLANAIDVLSVHFEIIS